MDPHDFYLLDSEPVPCPPGYAFAVWRTRPGAKAIQVVSALPGEGAGGRALSELPLGAFRAEAFVRTPGAHGFSQRQRSSCGFGQGR